MFKVQLECSPYEWGNAVAAFLIGTLMVFHGEHSFRMLICACMFMVASVMTMGQVEEVWQVGRTSWVRSIAGAAAGAIAVWALWVGFKGVSLTIGALIGCSIAYSLNTFVMWTELAFLNEVHVTFTIYALIIVLMTFLFYHGKHIILLTIISPFFGGLLVSSSVSYAVTLFFARGPGVEWIKGSSIQPVQGAWLQFAKLLGTLTWSDDKKDVGLFAGTHRSFELFGTSFLWDRWGGILFWFLLFVMGTFIQLKMHKKGQEEDKEEKKGDAKKKGDSAV